MSLEAELETWLLARPAIAALIDARLYRLIAPTVAVRPFVVYQRVTTQRERSLSGPSGQAVARFQVDCWGDSSADAQGVADALRHALDGFRGRMGAIRVASVTLDNEQEIYDGEVRERHVAQDYAIRFDEE